MTTDERIQVLNCWIKACGRYNTTLMVQIGGTNMKDVKMLAKHAQDKNVDAILCLPDLFFRPKTVNDLIHYLKIVSASAPSTPLLYYHIPGFTGIDGKFFFSFFSLFLLSTQFHR